MKAQRLSPQQQKTQLQLDKISAAFRQHFQTGNYQQAMREALKRTSWRRNLPHRSVMRLLRR